MSEKFDFRSTCPISSALDILGDKWSLLIIRDICLLGKRTYGEFSQSDEKIASNILADRLNRLEAHGIISKGEMIGNKKVKIYRVTDKGLGLLPILVETILWSDKYLTIDPKAKAFARELRKDKEGQLRKIAAALRAGA